MTTVVLVAVGLAVVLIVWHRTLVTSERNQAAERAATQRIVRRLQGMP